MKHQGSGNVVPPATLAAVSKQFNVNLNQYEVVTWPLYSRLTYTSGTTVSLGFFATPAGSGTTTYGDTNMDVGGQVASPQFFFLTGIELKVIPNLTSVLPSVFGAGTAAKFVNDVWAMVASKNFFELTIGSKVYVREPISKFTNTNKLDGFAAAADATTAAANLQTVVSYAANVGVPYEISPLLLPPTQAFQAKVTWPTAVTLPSAANPDLEMTFNGLLYRPAQ